ncbi:hypothetical protein OS175_09060 [Marinicella sp. S1101]|uniref:hypothetical protein n=1 Tax=Marinicella marina TaxID=2996016 RepID=UPI002260CF15|nr:hypothetical protein [Marinicella marina]MCX7554025.1 hypothetical protein [Marinicella marina]MDJ1140517.1 hypothetical protein [Marinicella marina]
MTLTLTGWIHTIFGIIALIAGFILLWQNKRISWQPQLGKIYLLATLLTAAFSLTIFNHGGFNVAHGLGILTILAVVVGMLAEKYQPLRGLNKYFVALCYSATILFHLLPTTTEIMIRFPLDSPWVSSLKDPLLHQTFLIITVIFLVMLISQMWWLRKQPDSSFS